MHVQANGIDIHYHQQGSGRDLLLLPGLGASVPAWYAQLRDLSAVLRVTAMDLRGHGRSSKPPGPYSIGLLADDVEGVLGALGIPRAVIVGSSMSSLVAVDLATRYPDRVSALVLVGGFATMGGEGRERFRGRAVTAEAEGIDAMADAIVGAALGASTHRERPGLVGLYRQALISNDAYGYAACCRAIAEADTVAQLPLVRCPVLILFGAEEQVAPLPAATILKKGMPHADIEVIPAAGHLPFLEQPAAFNAALLAFLARHPD